MPRKQTLVAIDLFAGCGGLTQGLKDAGIVVVGAVEINSLAAETYQMNHPEVQIWNEDIQKVSPHGIKQALGLRARELDVLAACPPCQGFSSIRTLNGRRTVADDRNDLVLRVVDFVEVFKPKAVMLENVPGLAKDKRFSTLTDLLRGCGYTYTWKIDDAARHGVPQRRKRFILVAARRGKIGLPSPLEQTSSVRDAISYLPPPGVSGDPLHDTPVSRSDKVQALIRQIPKDGGSRSSLGLEHQLSCHTTFDGFKDVYGRMAWDKVAPTITGGCINPSKGRFLHPEADRAITLREAALLQTFPRSYRFSMSRGTYPVAEMIGNALPPKFIQAHAREIVRYLQS